MPYFDEENSNEENSNEESGNTPSMPPQSNQTPKNSNKGNKLINAVGSKLGKNVGKAVLKLAGQALKAIGKFIITAVSPYVFLVLGIILLVYFAWELIFNSRGKSGDMQTEDVNEYNKVKVTSDGDVKALEQTTGNKLVKAFYTFYAEQSLYVTVTDKNGKVTQKDPIQYNSPEFIKKYGEGSKRKLKDKYNREKYFYLNPHALFVLDEYLNKKGFRYPEQFIKPVYHDTETLALKQLTDDKGELVAESKAYKPFDGEKVVRRYDPNDGGKLKMVYIDNMTGKDTFNSTDAQHHSNKPKMETVSGMAQSDEKVKGVWDYGFGSILNYAEFEEKRLANGNFKTMDIWDIDKQQIIYNVPLDEAKKKCESGKFEGYSAKYPDGKEFEDKLPGNTSYIIDKVTSPGGTITNAIVPQWVDTGEKYSKEEKVKTTISIKEEKEVQESKIDPQNPSAGNRPVYIDANGNETFNNTHTDENGVTRPNKPKMIKKISYRKEAHEFSVKGEGTIQEYIPVYEGDPDTSGITGTKYFMDYMTNYTSYVPLNVMTEVGVKSFTDRTGTEVEKLLKLLERESFTGDTVSDGSVDLSGFEFGSGAESGNVQSAMQYFEHFKEWGETYGVDPFLLIAKASQESSGRHDSSSFTSHGFGIMQIEQPGTVIKVAKAYNHKTKKMDEFKIPNREAVTDVSNNIRAGAMLQAERMKHFKYNMLFGLQAYNFGSGAFDKVINKYGADVGKTYDEILEDPSDLGWIPLVADLHAHPNEPHYLNGGWKENQGYVCKFKGCPAPGKTGHFGDPVYLQNVLQYYVTKDGSVPWVMKEDGTKVFMDGAMGTGSATPGGNDNWLSRLWDELTKEKENIFPKMPSEYDPFATEFTNKVKPPEAERIHKMMYVMEEKKFITEYEDYSEEDWKDKFFLWFKNPVGSAWHETMKKPNVKGIFPDGFAKPLTINPLTIETNLSLPDHKGIDITAPTGTDVFAVAGGEVIDVNEKGNKSKGAYIEIKHESGARTIYGGLSEIMVEKGEIVKGDEAIGKTGTSHDKKEVLYLELINNGKTIDPSWIISGEFTMGDFDLNEEDRIVIEKIIQLAHTKIGCPYTQAQGLRSGPNSFDCSGFIWWLYKTVTGVNVGTWTGDQDKVLNNYRVDASELQPGDILMSSSLSHVVLYAGKENGKDVIIHAANTKRGTVKDYITNPTAKYPKVYRPMAYVRDKTGTGDNSKPPDKDKDKNTDKNKK